MKNNYQGLESEGGGRGVRVISDQVAEESSSEAGLGREERQCKGPAV